jgi:hypothetical protein
MKRAHLGRTGIIARCDRKNACKYNQYVTLLLGKSCKYVDRDTGSGSAQKNTRKDN